MSLGLYIADIHLSNSLPFAKAGPDGVTDRLLDELAVLEAVREHAEQHSIPSIFILGDVFDRRLLDAITLKLGFQAIASLAEWAKVYIVPGNHDASDRVSRHYTPEALSSIANVFVFRGVAHASIGGAPFWAIPYMPDDDACRAIEAIPMPERHGAISLMHQTFLGAKVGDWTSDIGIDHRILDGFKANLSGHFHTHQFVGAGRGPVVGSHGVLYLGAPVQHHFGDAQDERGWCVIDTDDPEAPRRYVAEAPRFHVTNLAASEFDLDELSPDELPTVRPGDYMKWVIGGTLSSLRGIEKDIAEARRRWAAAGLRTLVVEQVVHAERKARSAGLVDEATGTFKLEDAYRRHIANCDVTGLDAEHLLKLAAEYTTEAEA